MPSKKGERGQAAVELVAIVPILLVATLVVAQLAVAGYALWSAAVAARAGARAAFVGGNAEHAARRSLPLPLRATAGINDRDGMSVRVETPTLIPGIGRIPLIARADAGVGDADGR